MNTFRVHECCAICDAPRGVRAACSAALERLHGLSLSYLHLLLDGEASGGEGIRAPVGVRQQHVADKPPVVQAKEYNRVEQVSMSTTYFVTSTVFLDGSTRRKYTKGHNEPLYAPLFT